MRRGPQYFEIGFGDASTLPIKGLGRVGPNRLSCLASGPIRVRREEVHYGIVRTGLRYIVGNNEAFALQGPCRALDIEQRRLVRVIAIHEYDLRMHPLARHLDIEIHGRDRVEAQARAKRVRPRIEDGIHTMRIERTDGVQGAEPVVPESAADDLGGPAINARDARRAVEAADRIRSLRNEFERHVLAWLIGRQFAHAYPSSCA